MNDDQFDPDAVPQETEEYAKTIHIPGAKEGLVLDSKRREKMLKSKKQLLKLKGAGQKLVFDDDGNAHQLYELVTFGTWLLHDDMLVEHDPHGAYVRTRRIARATA